MDVDVLDIARWQFGITTVYHFFIVPLTIGLSFLVAIMQTAWYRTGKPHYLAMTKFWGRLFLVGFALGVVTGIVQEFQFGMAWSAYSRFVGDVFGAPLAMEGLFAFFLESTFLGLWIFGWDRLPRAVHLATIWVVAVATNISALFILAANSWMQHPVGVNLTDRPRLTSIGSVLTNSTVVGAFPHTVAGAFEVAGAFVLGISAWQLARRHQNTPHDDPYRRVWHSSLRLSAWVTIVAFAVLLVTGDYQGKLMFQQQPMKMASAEALCHTERPASFSVFAVGDVRRPNCETIKNLTIPALLSFLAHTDVHSEVKGVKDLIPEYQARYGTNYPNDPALGPLAGKTVNYVPSLPVTYWSFRLMMGFGALAVLFAVMALWYTRRGRLPAGRWFRWAALFTVAAPVLANSFGWIFTEMGRQPFVVAPNPNPGGVYGVWMYTANGVSQTSIGEVLTSLIVLTVVYGALAVVAIFLMARYIQAGVQGVIPSYGAAAKPEEKHKDVMDFAY
jgi:cytochrome bd ubiquinol oxidase subunit I